MTGRTDDLVQLIALRGKQGAVAAELGVSDSLVSKWLRGQKTMTAATAAKLEQALADAGASPRTQDNQMTTDDNSVQMEKIDPPGQFDPEEILTPPDPAPIADDMDDLAAQVAAAHPRDVYTVSPTARRSKPVKMDDSQWRDEVWLPLHDLAAGLKGASAGPIIRDMARSDQGSAACECSHRTAERLGIAGIMSGGHWTADIAVMLVYAYAVREAVRGVDPERVAA